MSSSKLSRAIIHNHALRATAFRLPRPSVEAQRGNNLCSGFAWSSHDVCPSVAQGGLSVFDKSSVVAPRVEVGAATRMSELAVQFVSKQKLFNETVCTRHSTAQTLDYLFSRTM